MSLSIQNNTAMPKNQMAFKAIKPKNTKILLDKAEKKACDTTEKYVIAHRCFSGFGGVLDLLKQTFKIAFSFKKMPDCCASNRYKNIV